MLYEGALGNTSKQLERVVGFNGPKQWTRDRYSQKIQSLQVIFYRDPTSLFNLKKNIIIIYKSRLAERKWAIRSV